MHLINRHLGDSTSETLKDAIDEILAVLKDDTLNDSQRKREVDALLGLDAFSDEEFNNLQVLAQCLTDYNQSKQEAFIQNKNADIDQDIAIDLDQEDGGIADMITERKDDRIYQQIVSDDDENEIMNDKFVDNENINQFQNKNDRNQLNLKDINGHWLKRKLTQCLKQLIPEDLPILEKEILSILQKYCTIEDSTYQSRECEKELTFQIDKALKIGDQQKDLQQLNKQLSLISFIVKNRYVIYYGIIEKQGNDQRFLLDKIKNFCQDLKDDKNKIQIDIQNDDYLSKAQQIIDKNQAQKIFDNNLKEGCELKEINLDILKFQQGSRLMANKKCTLPKGSTRINKVGYEEIYVPSVRKKQQNEKLVQISQLPEWAQKAFPQSMVQLNRIQSALYKSAFYSDNNLLICAPTGAGKTNIALLACLQIFQQMKVNSHPNEGNRPQFNLKQFKIIYIAPMKALVTEIVGNFQARLQVYGIKVRELTGDVHLTKQQMEESNLIITTPEKWDIITRKNEQSEFVDLVKLIIIDEIHLLHDSRGPVLESIIARTMRQIEETQELVRIVALSATLPNYEDIAALLRVDPKKGLFFFDSSYRPVPLEQIYVGISEKKAIKRLMIQNEICYEKVIERVGKHQIIIFVHSRKETSRTGKIIRDMAIAQDKLNLFVNEDSESKKILMEVIIQKNLAVSQDIKDLAPYGIGIHHAGLSKDDRNLIEDLFSSGHLQVLVSTATLAWGVNLPAHTVIIKGTQIYSPEQGKWVELSHQDILQMMGRAGRPQYDVLGEGIIITSHQNLQYYLSLNNQQLPIESQMIQYLPDNINAEIVNGTISNIKDAVNWILYTYLYIRMRRNPELYGISEQDRKTDPTLIQMRINLAHSSALKLQKSGMIKYDQKSGQVYPTAIGKIASYFYIKCESLSMYNKELKPHMTNIDLFRLFAMSKEFENIPIRENEKIELQKFIDKVPIPVKGGIDEPNTKINILLQAYISRFQLEGFDLNADLVYVTQNASRIMRALYEIAQKKMWAALTENILNLCKMIEQRQWYCATPLRQFINVLEKNESFQDRQIAIDLKEITKRLEKKDLFKWQDLSDFSSQKLGELIKYPKMGKVIQSYLQKFPRLEISAFVQPITKSTIRVEIDLNVHQNFVWDQKFHGYAEKFLVFVCDGDSEQILHSEVFILYQQQIQMVHHLSFLVPLFDPLPPQYFIKVFSEKWLQADHIVPISFNNLILPEKFAAPSQLLEIHKKNIKELEFKNAEDLYEKQDNLFDFSIIQSQIFEKLYHSDQSLFIGVPIGGSESQIIAELSIFREIQKEQFGKIIYITPDYNQCQIMHEKWIKRLGEGNEDFGMDIQIIDDDLPGQNQQDYQQIEDADFIICSVKKWEYLSRKYRQKKIFLEFSLYIFDNVHMIQQFQPSQSYSKTQISSIYEILISRIKMMQSELQESENTQNIRMILLSSPVTISKDFCEFIGIDFQNSCFNFTPSVRAYCPSLGPLQVNIQAFDQNSRQGRMRQMLKPIYNNLKSHLFKNKSQQAILFTNSYLEAQRLALDIINICICDQSTFKSEKNDRFLFNIEQKVQDKNLIEAIEYGIGWINQNDPKTQSTFIKQAFKQQSIRILVCIFQDAWFISDLQAQILIIQNPECYCASERRFLPLEISTLLQIQSLAIKNLHQKNNKQIQDQNIAKSIIMCHSSQKNYFSKLISEQLPVESQLPQNLHDYLNSSIVSKEIQSIQQAIDWITWSLMYRRIVKNPNYYEIAGKTSQHINDYLSELIEDTVAELAEAGCINVSDNEMDIEATNIGRIQSFYNLKFGSLKIFTQMISKYFEQKQLNSFKMKQVFEILCQSEEFQDITDQIEIDEKILRQLALNLPYDISSDSDYSDYQTISNILIQCHLNRKKIPEQYKYIQQQLVSCSINQLHAIIDLIQQIEGNQMEERQKDGSLRPSIFGMELCQMIVQGMWNWQSPLLQLPYLTKQIIEELKDECQVNDIADFMNMDDDQRQNIVKLQQDDMVALAQICNRYPNLEIHIDNIDNLNIKFNPEEDSSFLQFNVILKRDIDKDSFENEEEYLQEIEIFKSPVTSRFFPKKKNEIWWLIVGVPQINKILNIKKITTLQDKPSFLQKFDIDISRDDANLFIGQNGYLELKVFAVCDSYIGCDLEKKLKVQIYGA